VFHYGDAGPVAAIKPAYPVRGVSAAPGGGIWAWTTHGNIYNLGGAPFSGSPFSKGVRTSSFRGFASTPGGHGYWLVESSGKVLAYGDAEPLPAISPRHLIVGMAR
jgi:hypothetical protein